MLSGPLELSDVEFPNRAEFVSFDHSGYANGTVKRAGAHLYQKVTSATTLADKAGWVPLPPYYLEQWGIVGLATIEAVVDNSTKIAACFAYCSRAAIYGAPSDVARHLDVSGPASRDVDVVTEPRPDTVDVDPLTGGHFDVGHDEGGLADRSEPRR